MIGIYKITNKENQKSYIGQSINIDKRVKEHFWKAKLPKERSYNSILHQAIRKYGEDSFSVKIIEECSVEELDEKEKYYIKQCNTITPNGYNISTGGQKTKAIPLFCKVCNVQITRYSKSGLCRDCYNNSLRKERPSKEELQNLLFQFNFSIVGRMFGVSDNSIRKWCKVYGLSTKASDYKIRW